MIPRRRLPLVAITLLLTSSTAAAWPARLELDLGGGQHLSLVLVHAATFPEGSPTTEAGRGVDEPLRDVTVGTDFYIGEVPVLRGQYARFVEASGYRTESETGHSGGYGFDGHALAQRPGFNWRAPGFAQTDEHPAVILTFDDATRFTTWASGQTGRTVRLPTEAEWELACRADTTTAYYNGADDNAARAAGWFRIGSGDGTRPVRGRAPNALGLFDMVGEVQQWVADWYAPYPAGPATDPLQVTPGSPPGEPARRVLRGGSWLRDVNSGRCGARSRATPGSRNADTGFRVAVNAETPVVAMAPPPPPSGEPTRSDDSNGSHPDTNGGLLICIAAILSVFGALGIGVWWLSGMAVRAVKLWPQNDGFRVRAPASYAGRVIRCHYMIQGLRHDVSVVYEPSAAGQFVYTGSRPIGLTVTGLDAVQAYVAPVEQDPYRQTYGSPRQQQHHDAPSPWFGRDPPAY